MTPGAANGRLAGTRVAVLGAGIGGLAAALAAARRGAEVTVLEQAPELGEVGAGIQAAPNGIAVLRALGLGEALAARAPRAQAIELVDGPSGRRVLRLDLARHAADLEYRLVHRADLVEILAEACAAAGVALRTGTRVTALAPGDDGVRLATGAGEETWPLVLGADGVRSVARPAVLGAAPPARFTGQVAWRALVRRPEPEPPVVRVHMAPGRHLVVYPLRDRRLLNLVAVEEREDWAEEGWHHRDDPAHLAAAFAGLAAPVRALLDRVEAVHLWGLFRHPVAPVWARGRLALLGDAAHPTLPFLAQGANMALEDAWVLARHLDAAAPEAALAAYGRDRRPRAERIVAAAEGNARNYHLRAPLVRGTAHLGLRALGALAPGAMLKRFDWLYRHDVTAAG